LLRLILAAGLAGLLATTAVAQVDPPTTEPAEDSTPVEAADTFDYDPLKIVCRKVRPPTGTRIISGQTRQSMCMSNVDWEQQELDAREVLRERDRGICAPNCGS
jgi:hypothetical protein